MDLDSILDGVYASAEPDQTASEKNCAGDEECLDNLVDSDFSATAWSLNDASQGY
jgi:hypothetical protein